MLKFQGDLKYSSEKPKIQGDLKYNLEHKLQCLPAQSSDNMFPCYRTPERSFLRIRAALIRNDLRHITDLLSRRIHKECILVFFLSCHLFRIPAQDYLLLDLLHGVKKL